PLRPARCLSPSQPSIESPSRSTNTTNTQLISAYCKLCATVGASPSITTPKVSPISNNPEIVKPTRVNKPKTMRPPAATSQKGIAYAKDMTIVAGRLTAERWLCTSTKD